MRSGGRNLSVVGIGNGLSFERWCRIFRISNDHSAVRSLVERIHVQGVFNRCVIAEVVSTATLFIHKWALKSSLSRSATATSCSSSASYVSSYLCPCDWVTYICACKHHSTYFVCVLRLIRSKHSRWMSVLSFDVAMKWWIRCMV
jgi:hypothetical protein